MEDTSGSFSYQGVLRKAGVCSLSPRACGAIIRVRDKGEVGVGPTAREGEIGGAARKLEKMYGAELGMPQR